MMMSLAEQVAALEARAAVDGEAIALLRQLKARVWGEACYDPYNDATQKFAQSLMPMLDRLNDKFKFSR